MNAVSTSRAKMPTRASRLGAWKTGRSGRRFQRARSRPPSGFWTSRSESVSPGGAMYETRRSSVSSPYGTRSRRSRSDRPTNRSHSGMYDVDRRREEELALRVPDDRLVRPQELEVGRGRGRRRRLGDLGHRRSSSSTASTTLSGSARRLEEDRLHLVLVEVEGGDDVDRQVDEVRRRPDEEGDLDRQPEPRQEHDRVPAEAAAAATGRSRRRASGSRSR